MKSDIPKPAVMAVLILIVATILGGYYMALNKEQAPLKRPDLGRGDRGGSAR